jgi:hypothetical protein
MAPDDVAQRGQAIVREALRLVSGHVTGGG